MGNIFAFLKQRNRSISISKISSSRSTSASANHRYPSMSKQASSVSTSGTSSAAASATPKENIISSARDKMKKKYSFIPDNFSSLEQVCFSCNFLFFFFKFLLCKYFRSRGKLLLESGWWGENWDLRLLNTYFFGFYYWFFFFSKIIDIGWLDGKSTANGIFYCLAWLSPTNIR